MTLAIPLVLALSSSIQTQTDTLVRDVLPKFSLPNPGSSTDFIGAFGDGRLLLASNGGLLVTDGTPGGTARLTSAGEIVFDGFPTADQPKTANLPDGRLVLSAAAGGATGVWVTDGTAAGTQLLLGAAEVASPLPRSFVSYRDEVYFLATPDPGSFADQVLFKTDGTIGGSVQLIDFLSEPGFGGAVVEQLYAVGDRLLLTMDPPMGNDSLWSGDGTPGSFVNLGGVPGPAAGTGVLDFAEADVAGGTILVLDPAGDNFRGLWWTDGLNPAAPLFIGAPPTWIESDGSRAFFPVKRFSSGPDELWVTDGTLGGTTLVAPVEFASDSAGVPSATIFSGGVAFNGGNPAGGELGPEPWFSDGTLAGTGPMADLMPGIAGSFPENFAVWNGALYFTADSPGIGREIWTTPDPAQPPTLMADLNPGFPGLFVSTLSELFVPAVNGLVFPWDTPEFGLEPWGTSGTAATSSLLIDAVGPTPVSSQISDLTAVGARVFFSAKDGQAGRELWTSDGSFAGTYRVADLEPGGPQGGAYEGGMVAVNDEVFFRGSSPATGIELFRSDGTEAGTVAAADTLPGVNSGNPTQLTPFKSGVLFFSRDAGVQSRLYFVDGAGGDAELLTVTGVASLGTSLRLLGTTSEQAFFLWRDVFAGTTLFATDGTKAGTAMVTDIDPGSQVLSVFSSAAGKDFLLFSTSSGLWTSDGTESGTQLLNVALGFGEVLGELEGRVVFRASQGLWITDGTSLGTVNLLPFSEGTSDFTMESSGGLAFIESRANFSGERELIRTDGTPAGTVSMGLLPSPFGGSSDSILRGAAGTEDKTLLALGAYSGAVELHLANGTSLTTTQLTDTNPGYFGSNPGTAVRAGERLFFVADDGETGAELHAIPFSALGTSLLQPFGVGCSNGGFAVRLGSAGLAKTGQSFDATLEDAPPGSVAFLYYSAAIGFQDLGGGCTNYALLPKFLGSMATDGAGAASSTVGLPANASLVGLRAALQAAVIETGGPALNAFALSSGLEAIVGP